MIKRSWQALSVNARTLFLIAKDGQAINQIRLLSLFCIQPGRRWVQRISGVVFSLLLCLLPIFPLTLSAGMPLSVDSRHSVTGDPPEPVDTPTPVDLPIHAGILGQGMEIVYTGTRWLETSSIITIATSLRGPAGGFVGDLLDWRNPYGIGTGDREASDPTTHKKNGPEFSSLISMLDFQRLGSRYGLELIPIVNLRGITNRFYYPFPWGDASNHYVDTSLETLTRMASDWVLYANYTVQNFNQARLPDANATHPLEARSARLLTQLQWGSSAAAQNQSAVEVLPRPDETVPARIVYWEIGNEPNYLLDTPLGEDPNLGISVSEFGKRYRAITEGMRQMDEAIHTPESGINIKMGPALMAPPYPYDSTSAQDRLCQPYLEAILEQKAALDFVSYHPYEAIFGQWIDGHAYRYNEAGQRVLLPDQARDWSEVDQDYIRARLGEIGLHQNYYAGKIRQYLASTHPQAELIASEWNPGSWESSVYLRWREKSMAQALAVMETIFSFAREQVSYAHYLSLAKTAGDINATYFPAYQTFKFLKVNLGDRLIQVYGNSQDDFRGYVTHNSGDGTLVFWGLNWGPGDRTVNLRLPIGISGPYFVSAVHQLQAPSLLHGAITSDPDAAGAPLLAWPLEIQTMPDPFSGTLWNQQIRTKIRLPANGWTAWVFKPAPVRLESVSPVPAAILSPAAGN